MADHNTHGPTGPSEHEMEQSVAAGYEIEDVSLSVLLRWGFGLGVFLLATSAFALILFAALQRPPFGPAALGETFLRREPPVPAIGVPILQDNPAGDPRPDNNPRKGIDNIREFRREEEIRMAEYATQDGEIHVPIERAMELALKDFEAQQPGEAASGVTPTPEMKIHAEPPGAGSSSGSADGAHNSGGMSSNRVIGGTTSNVPADGAPAGGEAVGGDQPSRARPGSAASPQR